MIFHLQDRQLKPSARPDGHPNWRPPNKSLAGGPYKKSPRARRSLDNSQLESTWFHRRRSDPVAAAQV
jgi:hypothetical protein